MTETRRTAKSWGQAITLVGIVAAWIPFAAAVPLDYKESVSGDLTGQMLGALDVGINKVSGATPLGDLNSSDFDDFGFTVETGTAVTSIRVVFATPTPVSEVIGAVGRFNLDNQYPASFPYISSVVLDLLETSSQVPFDSVIPLGAGDYTISNNSKTVNGPDVRNFVSNFTWEITVEPTTGQVPLPGTLMLLGAAVAGIGFKRRRRSR